MQPIPRLRRKLIRVSICAIVLQLLLHIWHICVLYHLLCGKDAELAAFASSLHNLKLYLPPMSQKGCCDCRSASKRITRLSFSCVSSSALSNHNIICLFSLSSKTIVFFCTLLFILFFSFPLRCVVPSFPLQLVKLCIGMIDAGKAYNAANKQFVSGIRELAQQSTKDEVIEVNKYNVITFINISTSHSYSTTFRF